MTRILFWLALVFLVVHAIRTKFNDARQPREPRQPPPQQPQASTRQARAAARAIAEAETMLCCPTAPSIIRRRKTCAAPAAITAAPRTPGCRRRSGDDALAGIVGRVARHVLALAANDERRARRHRRRAAGLPELRQPRPARLRPVLLY